LFKRWTSGSKQLSLRNRKDPKCAENDLREKWTIPTSTTTATATSTAAESKRSFKYVSKLTLRIF